MHADNLAWRDTVGVAEPTQNLEQVLLGMPVLPPHSMNSMIGPSAVWIRCTPICTLISRVGCLCSMPVHIFTARRPVYGKYGPGSVLSVTRVEAVVVPSLHPPADGARARPSAATIVKTCTGATRCRAPARAPAQAVHNIHSPQHTSNIGHDGSLPLPTRRWPAS
jgi:hypothetical protein